MTQPELLTRLRSYLLRAGAVALVAAIAYAGWIYWRSASEKPLDQRYRLEEVASGDLTQTVTANGTLNPVVLVNVGTQVSGTVKKLYADFNSRVQAGQILLELDPTTFRAAVEQSSGNLASADAALKLARANEQRTRELFALEYVSKQDLDQAIQAREAAKRRSRPRAVNSRATAPISPTASSARRSPAWSSRARWTSARPWPPASRRPRCSRSPRTCRRMQIDSNVAEADIGKIKVGQTARFTVDAFPGRRFEGKVKQIRLNPITQQNVVTYDVVVRGEQRRPDRSCRA